MNAINPSPSTVSDDFLYRLPKAELHLHIEGTLEPEMMLALAKRNDIAIPYSSLEEIRAAYSFGCLQDFLDLYYAGANVLVTEEDFYELALAYYERAALDAVRHAEIFFDPQTHTARGIPFATVIQGLARAKEEAKRRFGISSHLIMCFVRHLSEAEAEATLDAAMPYRELIFGVGLDSGELGNPPEKFARVFARARDLGFKAVAHAGEEGPAAYIWEALKDLAVSRIDHGVNCAADPELVEHLARHQIPLTVCPLSNLKLQVTPDLREHNLLELLEKGLCVTVNSDDPAYFGGYINENFRAVNSALGLTREQALQLAKNSFAASFISESERADFYRELDEYAAGYGA